MANADQRKMRDALIWWWYAKNIGGPTTEGTPPDVGKLLQRHTGSEPAASVPHFLSRVRAIPPIPADTDPGCIECGETGPWWAMFSCDGCDRLICSICYEWDHECGGA